MKYNPNILAIATAFVAIVFFSTPVAAKGSRVDTLVNRIHDGGRSKSVMIFAHRGNWRSLAENSLHSYQECIDAGLDGIEVDIQMSKDSVLMVMHDETLDRTTSGHGKLSNYTCAQLKELSLLSPIGVWTKQKIPTFEEVLIMCKDKILIQVDKWKPYAREISRLAHKHNCERQLIIRSTDTHKVFKEKYGSLFDKFIVIPVLVCRDDAKDHSKLLDFTTNYDSPVISFSFTRENFTTLEKIPKLKKQGYRIWLNSLWDEMNAGHSDELALTDKEASYGWLIQRGADIIFTDQPMLLLDYLRSKNLHD